MVGLKDMRQLLSPVFGCSVFLHSHIMEYFAKNYSCQEREQRKYTEVLLMYYEVQSVQDVEDAYEKSKKDAMKAPVFQEDDLLLVRTIYVQAKWGAFVQNVVLKNQHSARAGTLFAVSGCVGKSDFECQS